ncbi:MAG TPA: YCF48-related protein [Vicinamibacterales bacterium]|nr:YCF48-related protein [Vicinamibacterales bacterium]
MDVRTASVVALAALAASTGLNTGWASSGSQSAAPAAPGVTVPTSGLQWRNIGPFRGGRVGAVAGVIGQPNVFYIGLPFGGVWKTVSAGTTWFPVFDDVKEISSIASLAVAPSDSNVVYAGTGDPYRATYRGNGVYRSSDAGRTWRHLSLGDTKVPNIIVDPKDPDILLAAALGNVQTKSDVRGVFRSTDGGTTWTRTLFVDDETGVDDIAAAFDRPDVVFAVTGRYYAPEPGAPAGSSTSTGAIFKSTDGGQTWTKLAGAGLPALGATARGLRRLAVAAHTNAQRVFLAGVGPLTRSDDGGTTWKTVTENARPGAERVFVSPDNPDLVYGLHITAYRSHDGGATWEAFKGAPGGDDPHEMWIDPTDPNRILLAGDQGASVSVDGGTTWGSWYNQSTAQIYHIGLDSSWPYWVYGQQQDSGAVAVRSRGNLGDIGPLDWYPTPGWESGYITADPLNPKILFANGPDSASQLVRLSLPTDQWIHVGPNLDPAEHLGTPGPLVWNPFDLQELMAGYSKVMSTTDGGRHWKAISPDFTGSRASILALAASDVSRGLLWVGVRGGGVRVTRDHGAHWTDVSIPNTQGSVVSIDASHQHAAEAFAAVTTGDNRPHIYRTRDYGKTWTETVDGLPFDQASGSFVNAVRTDTQRAGLVFAATESSIYASFDDGDRWQPLGLNLPTTSVRDIVIHGDDLLIATFGRGIWVLDDYSPLRQITGETEQQPAHLFAPGGAVRVRQNIGGDTPFPPEIPHFENPPVGAVIYYSLSKPPSAPIAIDILDASGNVVRHLSSAPVPPMTRGGREYPDWWLSPPKPLPTGVGLNRINWDVRYDDPPSTGEHVTIRAVPGKTPMYYQGPLALPGVYTVRLNVDGTSYTQTVRVRNDPRSTAAPSDLVAQHELQMRIYRGAKEAGTAIEQVSALRVAAARLEPNGASAGSLAALMKSLDDKAPVAVSLDKSLATMNHLLEELDSADVAPTPSMTGAYAAACGSLRSALSDWTALQSQELGQVNAALASGGAPPVPMPQAIALPVCPPAKQ